jgi:hypothetical protein
MAEQHSPIIEFPTSAVQWAIRPKTKPSVFFDAQRAADGWIAASVRP